MHKAGIGHKFSLAGPHEALHALTLGSRRMMFNLNKWIIVFVAVLLALAGLHSRYVDVHEAIHTQ